MKKVFVVLVMLVITTSLSAKERVEQDSIPKNIPHHFLCTDLVYDVESIPNIGYEHFFVRNNRLKSWQLSIGYQMHYSDSFGVLLSHGDKISIGVYQGPAVKYSYLLYSRKHKKHWQNYFAPALCVKYLWYDDEYVKTGKKRYDPSYRIQSEKCYAAVPQFFVGAKRRNKWFCADFFAGVQLPVKLRDKTITQEGNGYGMQNPYVPYTSNPVSMAIAPVFGIKLGYIK